MFRYASTPQQEKWAHEIEDQEIRDLVYMVKNRMSLDRAHSRYIDGFITYNTLYVFEFLWKNSTSRFGYYSPQYLTDIDRSLLFSLSNLTGDIPTIGVGF